MDIGADTQTTTTDSYTAIDLALRPGFYITALRLSSKWVRGVFDAGHRVYSFINQNGQLTWEFSHPGSVARYLFDSVRDRLDTAPRAATAGIEQAQEISELDENQHEREATAGDKDKNENKDERRNQAVLLFIINNGVDRLL
jgi:hypothetical protein